MQIKDLKKDKRNYRKHNEKNLDLIKKSVTEVGLGRSIVIDKENEIICGNGLVSTLDNNTPIKVVETDGSELVVVKRTDLATDDDKRKQSYGQAEICFFDEYVDEFGQWRLVSINKERVSFKELSKILDQQGDYELTIDPRKGS